MANDAHEDVQRAVADHLEAGPDDLELIERTDTTYTFRQLSSGTTHTAHVDWPLVGELHLPSAFVFDLGVFAVVVGTTMLMLVAIAHQPPRAHPLPGEDTHHDTPRANGRAP